ncbi:Golgi-associated RAB2 interactor protein 3-like isoform X2 [Rhineura floridana]|uniref:Golgi-associated RAB2 interactor protein 3-like isoform X2 n=1 Tax=Rhineura floridana TaxID=261503 RepID=UPI002AC82954|nr:Golgi-associated RAB2 interactor protein 3-like isoform X2 [Rhineura floridana]XP_061463005.1 Golgi-associated RAB2 interactor protein 3-like isoform X2 [Rhineura floridana]XP_061463395.1 Golgi-associated RAB2 interactor protein 3-like isoform X2 [Rhineura floridana]
MGVLASSPSLLLPDLMIIARVKKGVKTTKATVKDLEITRLIPLHLVEIFVHNVNERQLKVKLATGRKYYLQLCAPKGDENVLFERWIRLAYMLHVASGRISDPVSFASKESGLHTIWKSASLRATSEKPWLPAITGAQSAEKLKEQLRQASLARSMSRSTESDLASQHSILKSGFASQGSVGISPQKEYTSREQSQSSAPKLMSKSATKQSPGSQVGLSGFRRPSESQKQSMLKQVSPHSFPRSRASAGAGPSQPFAVSEAARPSIPRTSLECEPEPVKLQKSKKSRSLVQTLATTLSQEDSSETHKEKESAAKSLDRSPGPSKPVTPSSRQGRKGPASQSPSTKQSRPASGGVSTKAPAASPAPKSRALEAAGPSDAYDVSVAAGPSEVGAKSMAAGPSRPTSQPAQMTSEKPAAAVAPSEPGSRGQESAAHSQTTNVKSKEPSKAQSSRPQTSLSRSPKKGRSTSWSPSRKEKKSGLQVHRTTASVAVGPFQQGWKTVGVGPSMVVGLITSRPQSGALGTDKESKDLAKQIQPSSAAGKQEPPRSQMSKNKLKKALSSARQRSSLTFVTIYSVLSSSMQKLKLSKSREDSKQVAVKPSKRVTISGVIGPSGKSVPEEKKEEEEAGNPELHTVDNLRMDAGSSAAAMMGTDTDRPPPQSHASMGEGAAEAKSPAVGGGNSEAAEFSRPGSQIIAREPGVANVTSQKSDQIKDVGQPSTPRLEDQD